MTAGFQQRSPKLHREGRGKREAQPPGRPHGKERQRRDSSLAQGSRDSSWGLD